MIVRFLGNLEVMECQKDEDKLGKRLEDSQDKSREVFSEKKSLHNSLDAVILRQKELEKEVLDLTDELVPVVSVYFKRAKEEVIFLYPPLDLSLLDPFKVVKGGVMVDEEVMTPHEPKPFPSLAEGVVREGGDPESLHLEPTIEEEIL
ncbi:hypothetical protein RYX36_003059 [Vicia faba]